MPKIHVLPDILASQVAAGEVVERPASVVKELVENSIDAGAREIRVDVDLGGAGMIRVSDDGCGMSREDALLSLERHATSKLRTVQDLAAIRTLGFRGEAVPSIASVSRFRMVTREADAVSGTEILVDGGKIRDVRDAGCAPGTVIEAKALFFNVPARRKFLRAESTEAAHIEHQLRMHALAAPGVRFRLRRNDRDVLDLAAVERSLDRVRQMVGSDLARELVELPKSHGNGIAVEGFLLPANHARKGRRHQCVFLNGRPVEDSVISRALAEGFRGAVAEGMHPAAWLWIEMEPTLVDVNVHPAKREVRFHRPLELKAVVMEAVVRGVSRKPAVQERFPAVAPVAVEADNLPPAVNPVAFRAVATQPSLSDFEMPVREETQAVVALTSEAARPEVPKFRLLGILHQKYVVMESADGLVLLDPKAAMERILYEKLMSRNGAKAASQGLLVPVLLELDPREVDVVLKEQEILEGAGLEVEAFGGNTIQIRSLPSALKVEDPRRFLGELLDELLHDPVSGARFARERVARILARRAAMGVIPRLEETGDLLARLFVCDLPYCTADGRPTLTEMGLGELGRRFGIRS